MSYSFSEIKKTIGAAVGLGTTIVAYIVADQTLSHVIPPGFVVAAGSLLTLAGVFFPKNEPSPSVGDKAITSLRDVQTEIDKTIAEAHKSLAGVADTVAKVQQTVNGTSGGSLVDQAIATTQ